MCVASAFAPQAWHLREAHDRTGGVVESYLGGRSNRLAPGLSGREQRGGVGVLRWSGEEVSTVGGVASRGDAPVRMSGRTKAVELLDAIEGRAGSASTMSTSVDDGDALFGVVLTSRYVTRHRKTTASTPLATTCARKPHRLRDAARGARAAGAPTRDARRVSRREMYASRATSRARFRAFASSSLITTPRDRPPAPL